MNFQRSKINQAVVAALVSMTANQAGADQGVIEEVVVTATKRAESTQDIPVTVDALTSDSLEDFGITNFEDYLIQLPGVTAGGSGPADFAIPAAVATRFASFISLREGRRRELDWPELRMRDRGSDSDALVAQLAQF